MDGVKKDYYQILGVERDADASELKKAYRKLAKKYHPDSNEGNAYAAERFKEVNEAYGILGDEKKRKLYDQYGDAAFDGTGNAAGGSGTGGFGNTTFHEFHFEDGDDMDDIFKEFFGGGSFFHQRAGGGFRGRQNAPEKGSDIQSNVTVSFDEAAFGSSKRIRLQREDGQIQILEVRIPAGISNEKVIRLKGKGAPGRNGGPAGDLLLKVFVQEKPGFKREGQDLYTTVRIPFTVAVLGGETRIQTIYGDVQCRINPGTQSGSQIRLKNKGIVSMGNPSVHGDQYVTVEVQVPTDLSREAKEKLMEFQRACGKDKRWHVA